jgi:hypothetical protein
MKLSDFSIDQTFQLHYDPGVDSASSRNENQDVFLGVKGLPVCTADNLITIWEPFV